MKVHLSIILCVNKRPRKHFLRVQIGSEPGSEMPMSKRNFMEKGSQQDKLPLRPARQRIGAPVGYRQPRGQDIPRGFRLFPINLRRCGGDFWDNPVGFVPLPFGSPDPLSRKREASGSLELWLPAGSVRAETPCQNVNCSACAAMVSRPWILPILCKWVK